MYVAILTSTNFDNTNQPLIKDELKKSGHRYKEFKNLEVPPNELLNFDIVWDRSAIINDLFFESLEKLVSSRDINSPILINSPQSIMNSYDKIRTHHLIGEYSPTTIIYNGTNFDDVVNAFSQEEYIVIKQPRGWQASGVERILFTELSQTALGKEPVLIQKYIEPKEGVSRALILCYDNKVEPIAWYNRVPDNHWRTGPGSNSEIVQITPTDSMREFISKISLKSGLFLNGIDYISIGGKHFLLEVNSVPRLSTSVHQLGINAPRRCILAMEEIHAKRKKRKL